MWVSLALCCSQGILRGQARACHLTINRLDYAVLTKHLGPQARCLPNLAERRRRPSRTRIREARNWLTTELGHDGPVWIFPTRFLRRKNLAEAVLLTRWLRPEAWFVTTAGVSSREEKTYARRLATAALREKWKVHFRILDGKESSPPIEDLAVASEVMLLTSAQEGFLPYLRQPLSQSPLSREISLTLFPTCLNLDSVSQTCMRKS